MEYLFSLIIPCHNPNQHYIKQLFDSLLKQNIEKEDLQIIIVDDNSDNLEYHNLIKKYNLNTEFVYTNVNIHCPGNTRREGMFHVKGQWVFFCDQDDFFEDNALIQIKNYINQHKQEKIYVISTNMRAYNEKTKECHHNFIHKPAWLHGKWYSMNNLIKPFNINFKKDLITHEDIYFNSTVLSKLYFLKKEMNCLDIFTYRWVDNPESLTRKPTNDRGYLFENFNDYLVAAGESYWEEATKYQDPICINQLIMTLLHAYFYYEAADFYEGPDDYQDIFEIIRQYSYNIQKDLKFTPQDIIDFVYVDPAKYDAVKEECDIFSGKFIPNISFRDFIYKLGAYK